MPKKFDSWSKKGHFRSVSGSFPAIFLNIFIAPKDLSLNFFLLLSYFWAIVLISAFISILEDFGSLLPARTVTVNPESIAVYLLYLSDTSRTRRGRGAVLPVSTGFNLCSFYPECFSRFLWFEELSDLQAYWFYRYPLYPVMSRLLILQTVSRLVFRLFSGSLSCICGYEFDPEQLLDFIIDTSFLVELRSGINSMMTCDMMFTRWLNFLNRPEVSYFWGFGLPRKDFRS